MSILIRDMNMPTTGLYLVSVDSTGGRDKTVVTVERMLRNRDVRHIVGSFEAIHVSPHGRLIDRDALEKQLKKPLTMGTDRAERLWDGWNECTVAVDNAISNMPTIIQADYQKEE